jgi:hypothetical protein
MTAPPLTLYALNDFFVKTKLFAGNPTTGAVTPLTAGTVTAFLATSNTASATAADPALSMSPTHLGDGVWLIFFDAAVLTTALLDPLFGSTPPYLIIQQPGGLRVYAPVTYTTARPALVGYL